MDVAPSAVTAGAPSAVGAVGVVDVARVVELLAAGMLPSQVARSVGCDASYITQLAGQEDVIARIQELRLEGAEALLEKDKLVEDLERAALEKMEKLLPLQMDLMKVTKVYQVLNGARRMIDKSNAGMPQGGATVNLTFPAQAAIALQLSTDNQVVQIAGRSMTPLPSHVVAQQMRDRRANRLLEQSMPKLPDVESKPASMSKATRNIIDEI